MLTTLEFYKQIYSNLNKNKEFMSSGRKKFSYKDIKRFFINLNKSINITNNKQIKICTIAKKSFFLYSSIISILISKNIWISIDENLSKQIIAYILKITKCDIVFIDNENEKKFQNLLKNLKIKYVNIEKIKINYNQANILNIKMNYRDNDLAMIFFTSGSTGMPKGVNITNRNFISCLDGQIRHIYNKIPSNKMVFGDYHNISFIISVVILIPCVFRCNKISTTSSNEENLYLLDHVKKNGVNCIITTPSTIKRIKIFYNKFPKLNLKVLILCGERFHVSDLKFIIKNLKPKYIFNCYGSTEVSPWVFTYQVKNEDLKEIEKIGLVPIGNNFFNTKFKINKKKILLVKGPMTAKYINYRNNKKNNFWYNTKDKVKIINKLLYLTGRSDSVVKLRGFRIDIKAIETQIRRFDLVKDCHVFVHKEKIIAAVITQKKNINLLNDYLIKNLPYYMQPKELKIYSKFPLNRSQKINYKFIEENYIRTR